jgi:hypothetical protein
MMEQPVHLRELHQMAAGFGHVTSLVAIRDLTGTPAAAVAAEKCQPLIYNFRNYSRLGHELGKASRAEI